MGPGLLLILGVGLWIVYIIYMTPDKETTNSRDDTQPNPVPNNNVVVWETVIEDMKNRNEIGFKRYGTYLQPHNNRDALKDAYDEALDLSVYLKQAILERDNNVGNS